MGVGAGAGFEHLGAELVAHEDVGGQIDVPAAHIAGNSGGHLDELATVGGEMQIRTADSARTYVDQHLARPGHRFGHVVPAHHAAIA